MLDRKIVVSRFELLSRYNVHIQTNTIAIGMNPLTPPAKDLIIASLFFYKDGFDIK